MQKRGSGILLAITSLPSEYGIGTLGRAVYEYIDFLEAADQKYWQVLPVGPVSYGDSPYQSFSTFAGNPYLVDLDMLIEQGLLEKKDVENINWGSDSEHVDYGKIYENRFDVLKIAYNNYKQNKDLINQKEIESFYKENESWLEDYALFMALKRYYGMKPWISWPDEEIRIHSESACKRYADMLADEVEYFRFIQYLFFSQWTLMKAYARKKGIEIIGDVPIYVALDSADVWSGPEWFYLDEENIPVEISGVPPDAFNEDGQLWGNPLYRWDMLAEDGYGWWIRRVDGAFRLYDALRIDHFRGFESYWAVPYGETTAKKGRWVKGPDKNFVRVLKEWFSDKKFIAEDLGFLTPQVKSLLDYSGFPGMKVLQFAFDSREASNYLPHTYQNNCICYTGTHDNTTLGDWPFDADESDVRMAKDYLGVTNTEDLPMAIIRGGMSSVANTFIAQMQDYLGLGAEARMNKPGIPEGNWTWRMKKGAASDKLAEKIAQMTKLYGRSCR